jgi:Spy/CpxP family protein refolding chaperone
MLAHISEELELSDQQEVQVKTIIEQNGTKIHAVREQFHTVRQQSHAEISAVLDEQQRQQFESFSKQKKGKQKGHKSADEMLANMREKLDLSDAQAASINTILDNSSKQMNDIHMEKRELRQQLDTEIKAVLNDQQQAKFDAMRQQRKEKCKGRKGKGGATE